MEPARSIIKRLGGPEVVSRITGTAKDAPYRWTYAIEKKGTGGLIPQKYHRALLDYAQAQQIPLSADEFLPPREAAE